MNLKVILFLVFFLFIFSSCSISDENIVKNSDKINISYSDNLIEIKSKCNEYCNYLKVNFCDEKELVKFCEANFQFDLNANKILDESYIDENQGFEAYTVCEDKVYCMLIGECACNGVELNIQNCKIILKKYYDSDNLYKDDDVEDFRDKLKYTDGLCMESNLNNNFLRWNKILYDY